MRGRRTVAVSRGRRTPKNPHGVAVGQRWERTDFRDRQGTFPYDLTVIGLSTRSGLATVKSDSGRTTRIKLARFEPASGYRLL